MALTGDRHAEVTLEELVSSLAAILGPHRRMMMRFLFCVYSSASVGSRKGGSLSSVATQRAVEPTSLEYVLRCAYEVDGASSIPPDIAQELLTLYEWHAQQLEIGASRGGGGASRSKSTGSPPTKQVLLYYCSFTAPDICSSNTKTYPRSSSYGGRPALLPVTAAPVSVPVPASAVVVAMEGLRLSSAVCRCRWCYGRSTLVLSVTSR